MHQCKDQGSHVRGIRAPPSVQLKQMRPNGACDGGVEGGRRKSRGKTERDVRVREMDGRTGGISTSGRSAAPRALQRTQVRFRSTRYDIPSHLHSYLHSFRPHRPQPNPPSAAGSGRAKEYAISISPSALSRPDKTLEARAPRILPRSFHKRFLLLFAS